MFYVIVLLFFIIILLFMKITIMVEASPSKIKVRIVIFRLIKKTIIDKTKREHGRLDAEKIKKGAFYKGLDIRPAIKDLKGPVKRFLSKLQIVFKLRLVYGMSSPDKTAISYGILNSLIYTLDLGVKGLVKKYKGSYTICPDMKKTCLDYSIEAGVSFRVFSILPSIFKMLEVIFKQIYAAKRKEGLKDGRTSNRKLNENYNGQP